MESGPILTGEAADRDLERRIANYFVGRRLPSLDIEASGGVVTLGGRVRSIAEKQLAIDSCQRVAGVIKLIDTLDVPAMHAPDAARAKSAKRNR